jgi:hypothetical protein
MKVLILTSQNSTRADYIFKLIFNNLLTTEFIITYDIHEFNQYENVKFNYTNQYIEDAINITPAKLLFEDKIQAQEISSTFYNDIECIFKTNDERSTFPFDPFAAAFYLVSRYEEYLPFTKDEFGRFEADQSISSKLNFLDKPVVNIWAKAICRVLNEKYPKAILPVQKYSFIPTYDIDIAYAFKGKGLARNLGASFKDILKGKFKNLLNRVKVMSGSQKDPFDCYDYIFETHDKNKLNPIFFLHPGTSGKFDKNISLKSTHFKSLINHITKNSEIGIHSSFRSVSEPNLLDKEINELSLSSGKQITKCRQHFINLKFPETFRNFIKHGITDDYSLGYASHTGFRAGICTPFYFYDLKAEEETKLLLHPFSFMDGASKIYMNLNNNESITQINKLIQEIKEVNGTFISLWHNESLADTGQWKGWRKVYESMIERAIS